MKPWQVLGIVVVGCLSMGQQRNDARLANERLEGILSARDYGCAPRNAPCDLRAGTTVGGKAIATGTGGSGGGAPTTVNYLVGTADAGLSAEIVVGATPGGELGGTWASPTVDSGVVSFGELAAGVAADAQVDGSLEADEVNPTLGTQTQGNFVASVATTAPLTGGAAGSEGGTLTLGLNQNAGTNVANDLEEEAHASEHQHGGSDEIASASPGTNLIVKSGPTGTIDANWVPTTFATDAEVIAYAHPVNTELTWLTTNCPLENDGTPIPDSCVGDGTDGGGGGGGAGYAEIAAAALAGF